VTLRRASAWRFKHIARARTLQHHGTMPTTPFAPITLDQLDTVNGGLDIGGLVGNIAGMVDKHAGTNGEASRIAGQVLQGAQSFGLLGGGGSSSGGGASGGE
jgi:hypothetical protein